MRWAALIQRVYEFDPLECPKCGGEMKIISFIEKHQADVIEKIATSLRSIAASRQPVSFHSALKHCGLWIELCDRGPPAKGIEEQPDLELEYVNCEDILWIPKNFRSRT